MFYILVPPNSNLSVIILVYLCLKLCQRFWIFQGNPDLLVGGRMGKKAPLTREEQIGVGENYAILQDKMTEIYGVSDRIP